MKTVEAQNGDERIPSVICVVRDDIKLPNRWKLLKLKTEMLEFFGNMCCP
jgi:hypothetical protein